MEFIQKLDKKIEVFKQKLEKLKPEIEEIVKEFEQELLPKYFPSEVPEKLPLELKGSNMKIIKPGGFFNSGFVVIIQETIGFSIIFLQYREHSTYSESNENIFSPSGIRIDYKNDGRYPSIEINAIKMRNFCEGYVFQDSTLVSRFLAIDKQIEDIVNKIINLEDLKRKEACIILIEEATLEEESD